MIIQLRQLSSNLYISSKHKEHVVTLPPTTSTLEANSDTQIKSGCYNYYVATREGNIINQNNLIYSSTSGLDSIKKHNKLKEFLFRFQN